MSSLTPRTTLSSLLGRFLVLAAIAVASLALLNAAPAHADTKNGPAGSSKGCAVEDESGNVTYVPEGTQYLLFTCGSDGEWHFGWLVQSARPVQPTQSVGNAGGIKTATGGKAIGVAGITDGAGKAMTTAGTRTATKAAMVVSSSRYRWFRSHYRRLPGTRRLGRGRDGTRTGGPRFGGALPRSSPRAH